MEILKAQFKGRYAGRTNPHFEEETYRPGISIKDFKPGDLIYVQVHTPNDKSYYLKGEFVSLVRASLTVRVIGVEEAYLWGFYGGKNVTIRYTRAYLWGKGPGESYPTCHWFKPGGLID